MDRLLQQEDEGVGCGIFVPLDRFYSAITFLAEGVDSSTSDYPHFYHGRPAKKTRKIMGGPKRPTVPTHI